MGRATKEPAVRVSKLGYVQFTTPDVDRMVHYYTKVLDFVLVDQAPDGAHLTTGSDHHSVVIAKGDARARSAVGYEIWGTIADAQRRLQEAGYDVDRRGDIGPGTPDALVLIEPSTRDAAAPLRGAGGQRSRWLHAASAHQVGARGGVHTATC